MNVIHVATIEDAPLVNQVAEMLVGGSNNLSVLLEDKDGNQYLGCHSSAWTVDDFESFKRRDFASLCTQEQLDALDRLYESAMDDSSDYSALDHLKARLDEWGLSVVHVEEI